MNIDDTIVAVSSPPGAADRGIVRLTGPGAFQIVEQLFQPESMPDGKFARLPPEMVQPSPRCLASLTEFPKALKGTVHLGEAQLPSIAYVFKSPGSYTAQDTVELHTIGSPVLLAMIVEAAIQLGARRAEAGEFTARAFLAGRLDLSQVHGIAGMIAARSDLQLKAAERLLHGALSQRAMEARESLADLLSLVEGAMDFADEPIEFIAPDDLRSRLAQLKKRLTATVDAGLRAERWGRLPRVLLIGKPNAGKSSLLNRLTGLDRAICTPVAGTTRDVLTAPMTIGDHECLLVDVAGLDDAARHRPDILAQAMAHDAIGDADLFLLVMDITGPIDPAQPALTSCLEPAASIVVGNKCDLASADQSALFQSTFPEGLVVSAQTGAGCDALAGRIAELLTGRESDRQDDAIALMAEHRASLDRAIDAIDRAITLASTSPNQPGGADCSTDSEIADAGLANADLVAAELRIAADELGVLVGQDQTEDLLGRIFSRFCVGK